MLKLIFCNVFLIVTILTAGNAQSQIPNLANLDQYIEASRKQWKVPGISVAIVYNGETLLSKGYGVASIESLDTVDEETLFMIGSTTKAMTAAAMAMLVDEGKIKWSDKVIDHLEWFRLSDPFVTRELTIEDLFTHNTGLGSSDLLWVLWDYSTEEIIKRIANQPLSYSMRGGYTYQNIMYVTAGLVIEKVSNQSWDSFIHERIFRPLGMNNSCALKSCAETNQNRTSPHFPMKDGIIQIIDSNADSVASAGSAWSCADDISKWMHFVLNEASVSGKRLISQENFDFINSPKIIIPKEDFYPTTKLTEPRFTAYSLGWFNQDYKGEYVQFHTGSLNGSGAIIGLIPEKKLGVYVMVNLDHAEVRHAIMFKVFDYLLGLGQRDWSTDIKELYDERTDQSRKSRKKMIESREMNRPATIASEEIKGLYKNEFLGELTIEMMNNELIITCRKDRHISLSHWHYNTYMGKITEYQHDQGDLIDFDRSANGIISFNLFGHEFTRVQ